MELLRGDQTTRRGVRLACGVIALATLALAACNNETQTGPGGANTLVFVGNVNGANASLAGSIVMTIDETRAAATFKVIAPSSDDGTGTGEDGIATIGEDGAGIGTGDAGTATGEGGTATGDAGISTGDRGTGTNEAGTANGTQTSTTLQDTTKSKSWKTDLWVGRPVTITAGTGAGQTSTVTSNTTTTLTVSPAWSPTPEDAVSKYVIKQTPTTLQDITKAWPTDLWATRPVTITAGTGAGQTSTVTFNTATTLTVSPAWPTTPDGTSQYVITQTSTTLQDTSKSGTKAWPANLWAGRPVTITAGTGAGQTNTVTSNTANTLTVSPWITTPDGTSKYVITQTSTALQDTSKSGTKAWTINQWAGRLVTITAGPGAGQTRTVSSNTTNTLTVSPAWSPIPDGTSQYVIGQTSTTLQDTTKSGTNAWTINQWANRLVTITAGAGAGQTSTVMSNTTNTLTVSPAWATTPDGTSKYVIKQTPTTFQDITKSWTAGQWAGRPVRINAGTGAGQTRTVSTNDATTLTVSPAWDPTPDGASEYVITQTSTTLRDTTKVWTTDQWAGRPVTIKAGSGAGQASTVSTNTGNTLTVSPAWTTTPDGSSEYVITQTSTTLQDITKSWTTDQWKNHKVSITAGTGAGQTVTVTSNTANTLTVKSAWTTKPDGSSRYVIGVGATATIALNGAYNSSSRAVSASGGGYAFDGTYDGSSRLEGTFTGPSSASGTFRSERATSNPMGYCGPFTSTTTPAGYNGIFNVTMSGLTLYGTATADNGTVFALDGTVVPGDNGVGTGAAGTANGVETSTTLQDTTQAFKTDQWAGRPVRITAGLGAGQIRTVVSNTATTLTVSPAWTTTPEDAASEYVITQTSTTFEAKKKTWTTDQWKNNAVFINAGAGAGQTRTVSSNTATTLTVSPAWDRNPDGTSQYVIAIGLSTGTPFPATGMGNSTISRLAGTFNDGAGNQGTWYGARCDQ